AEDGIRDFHVTGVQTVLFRSTRRGPAPAMTYPKVPPSPSLPELEQSVLDFWESDKTFQASIDQREAGAKGENEYVFYDGPPFAKIGRASCGEMVVSAVVREQR